MHIVGYYIINASLCDTFIANSLMSYTSTTQTTEHNAPKGPFTIKQKRLDSTQYLSSTATILVSDRPATQH